MSTNTDMFRPISDWAEALRATLHQVNDPTSRSPVPWLLTGDAALVLQGVSGLEPTTIEFAAISPFAVAYFAQLMKVHEGPDTAASIVYRLGGQTPPSDQWCSNRHQRVMAWNDDGRMTWLGRWRVANQYVQVSYSKDRNQPDLIGHAAKCPVQRVSWRGLDVAVVPIQYGLVGSVLRNNTDKTRHIMHTIRKSGVDITALQGALAFVPAEKRQRIMRSLEFTIV